MPPKLRRAFTLVELLVVIGIITLLIAILLPALGKAREQANWIKCAAQLRSIGHAMAFYVQEYDHYPGASLVEGGPGFQNAVWLPRLRPFLDRNQDIFFCPSRDVSFRWDNAGPEPLARAVPPYTNAGYEPGEPMVGMWAPFSYGYNAGGYGGDSFLRTQKGLGAWPRVAGTHTSGPNDEHYGEMPASRIRRPTDMIAVADSDADGFTDFIIEPQPEPARSPHWQAVPGRVHSGGANVLFCDGHVTWHFQEDLIVNKPPGPADLPKIRMWTNDYRAPGDK